MPIFHIKMYTISQLSKIFSADVTYNKFSNSVVDVTNKLRVVLVCVENVQVREWALTCGGFSCSSAPCNTHTHESRTPHRRHVAATCLHTGVLSSAPL